MRVALESNGFFMGIEYLAVFFCGIMGGLSAIKRGYDLFSIVLVAWLTALGGGILRDVLLGDLPPVGISDRGFVLTALAAGLVAAFAHPEVERMYWTMIVVDALALGLFAVNGTAKSLSMHGSGMTAVFMGMFTALGGGLIRDTLLNEVPMVIRDRHWYAVPTAVGCVLTVVVFRATQRGDIGLHIEMALDVGIVALVVVMRVLSVAFNITLPGAVERDRFDFHEQGRYLARPVIHPHGHGARGGGGGQEGDSQDTVQ
ncbi:TRIC cation channel family protein [uncultured Bifidobacterium sp.]|uniref:trimeric intracellular cation channel family protein n=1 Tax=uncultured Bifidobacterium sp. TaxID=165187 RepID=UPI002629B446|nr:TRIC cation channel family protein [uncultured Bifidobacterium sp.]